MVEVVAKEVAIFKKLKMEIVSGSNIVCTKNWQRNFFFHTCLCLFGYYSAITKYLFNSGEIK